MKFPNVIFAPSLSQFIWTTNLPNTNLSPFHTVNKKRKAKLNNLKTRNRYVAMHTMQESENPNSPSNASLEPDHGGGGGNGNGYLDGGSHHHHHDGRALHRPQREGRSLKLVLVAVAGMLLPLVTQIGHAH